jgi:hypothetical protein
MADIPRQMQAIKVFKGMATNIDPSDLNPGVSELQVNVNGFSMGKLEVRRGLRELQFEEDEDD